MENANAEGINMTIFVIMIAAGAVLFAASLVIRERTGGKYEVRYIDLILLLLPVILWLLGTGRITRFELPGGGSIEMAQAFARAAEKRVDFIIKAEPESLADEINRNIQRARKEGTEKIPEFIRKKTEALEFELGLGGYWGPAIKKYMETLIGTGFLRYVVIYERGGSLFGVYDSEKLFFHLESRGEEGYRSFAEDLNSADAPSREALQRLPGFVPVKDAATEESSKRAALETMERLDSNFLPVVDNRGNLIGMVEREKIATSLIIDVTKEMERLSEKGEGGGG